VTGWINPTPDQLDDARRYLAQPGAEPTRWALDYIGAHLNRIGRGDFDHNDIRRALAMYRVYEEVDGA
jgi:hypothetical protein